jgi:hypothetical protein
MTTLITVRESNFYVGKRYKYAIPLSKGGILALEDGNELPLTFIGLLSVQVFLVPSA